jgi:hypothetical protein
MIRGTTITPCIPLSPLVGASIAESLLGIQ